MAMGETLHKDPQEAYEEGWQEGFDACQKRYMDILRRFPMSCNMILTNLPLHPSQPNEILEPIDWLQAQGVNAK